MVKRKPKPAKPMVHVKKTHPMWRYGKDPKQPRITSYIGLILMVLLLLWGIRQISKLPEWINDQRMDMLARDVFNTEIPYNTTVTQRQYDMTNMPADRACVFVVRQDMLSYLSEQELTAFYAETEYRLRFPPFAMLTQRYSPNIVFADRSTNGDTVQYALSVRIELRDTLDSRCSTAE